MINELISEVKLLPDNLSINSLNIINSLPISLLNSLSNYSVYLSKYDTSIIELSNTEYDIVFDIGSKTFGFFVEQNGKLVQLLENLSDFNINYIIYS